MPIALSGLFQTKSVMTLAVANLSIKLVYLR